MNIETARSRIRRARSFGLEYEHAELIRSTGSCAVCGHQKPKLYLDHSHQHGGARGWLCGNCNVGLGMFKDDPKRLRAAADYLEGKARVVTLY
jgi:hypothetical protein